MTTLEVGHRAERAAVVYLEMRGYEVLEQNWRRPMCEIDIVAKKDEVIYFVEVRYRFDDKQGGGLETITAAKLKMMRRGAYMWVEENEWPGETSLGAVEIAGPTFAVMSFIDNVL